MVVASPHGSPGPFAALDSVDWAKFRPRNPKDAERDAGEIPTLIRGLAAAEGQAAREWGERLRGTLIHGHSGLYLRTAEPAAPFLIELCRSRRPEVAAEALSLLLSCVGEDGPFHPEPLRPGDTRVSEFVGRTRAVVHSGRAAYYPWLGSAHSGARVGALELLGVIEPTAPEFQRELARLEASDENHRIQRAIREIRRDL
ncbi:hypothetical protein [Micromonospora sp. NPDC047074]|uniref:hypothetical protein n=1 Tax=Micromonospora sp. NPDC047074 TaxID=3154339 RepID=UPI0033C9FC60